MKCEICNKEVKNYKGLSSHLRQTHKIKSQEYYDTYLKQENDGICLTCNNKTTFQNIKNGYAKFCSSKCAHNNQDVLNKISCTCTERYGGLGTSSKILQEKIINTTIKNHGVKNVYMREDLKQKSHSKESKLKEYKTKKKNNTFNTSKIEKELETELRKIFPNLKTQYRSKKYPFNCDYYIPELDLYIEYNGTWLHGDKFFDKDDLNDLKKLSQWTEKSKNSKFYKNAIETWTVRDVNKLNTALKNNLNYITWFNQEHAYNWIEKYKENNI